MPGRRGGASSVAGIALVRSLVLVLVVGAAVAACDGGTAAPSPSPSIEVTTAAPRTEPEPELTVSSSPASDIPTVASPGPWIAAFVPICQEVNAELAAGEEMLGGDPFNDDATAEDRAAGAAYLRDVEAPAIARAIAAARELDVAEAERPAFESLMTRLDDIAQEALTLADRLDEGPATEDAATPLFEAIAAAEAEAVALGIPGGLERCGQG